MANEDANKILGVGQAPDGKLHLVTEADLAKPSAGEYKYTGFNGNEVKIVVEE